MDACVSSWVCLIIRSYVWCNTWALRVRRFVIVRHDTFICETWLRGICDMTHFICVTWLIHMCDMHHHEALLGETWLVHICDMSRPYECHASWFAWAECSHGYVSFAKEPNIHIWVPCLMIRMGSMLAWLRLCCKRAQYTHMSALPHDSHGQYARMATSLLQKSPIYTYECLASWFAWAVYSRGYVSFAKEPNIHIWESLCRWALLALRCESCRIYERIMSHIWESHVAYRKESCRT